MQKSKIKILIFCFVILHFTFYILHFAPKARAQSLGLGIYPPLLEVVIMPGKTITQVYKLSNPGEVDLVMTSSIFAFEPSDETGGIKLLPSTQTLDPISFSFLNANLKLGQTFPLPTGSTQEVVLKIKIPETAREKDYYATLIFQTSPMARFGAQSTSQTQTKIGGNILISVSRTGQPIKKAEIVEFSAPRFIDSFSHIPFNLRIKNVGHSYFKQSEKQGSERSSGSYFKPLGKIVLKGWFGQEETLDLLPQNVLSDSIRKIQCQIDNQVASCQTKSKFLIGPFRAKLEFGLDDFSGEYQQEIRLIVLPIKLIIALFALTIILWLIKTRLVLDRP